MGEQKEVISSPVLSLPLFPLAFCIHSVPPYGWVAHRRGPIVDPGSGTFTAHSHISAVPARICLKQLQGRKVRDVL